MAVNRQAICLCRVIIGLMEQAILKTLAYADIFDYPITAPEIWRCLIIDKRVGFEEIKHELERPNKLFKTNGEYFFLKNRQEIVKTREKREKWSREKLKIARRVAGWLRLIPTIKMVGITGALAMKNSDEADDIDFLIATAKNRLWLTRLLSTILVELVAKRRHPGDENFCDKICLNMFLDEDHLEVPKKEQDLFSAHEVCQLKLIWGKNGIYKKFISQNRWSKKYLANWRV